MPKTKRKAPTAADAIEEPVDDDEPVEEGEDDDDEEDTSISLEATESKPSVQIDFGFFDPKEADFHGIRALLSNEFNSILPSGATFDISGLAGVLCEQVAVGSVAKVIAPGSEEPADPEDVLGFMSAISLQQHRDATFVKELTASCMQRCSDASERARLKDLLASTTSGLLVSARMLNLPPALVPDLIDALMQDLAWAVENCDDQTDRESFAFKTLLLVAAVQLPDGASAASSSAPIADGGKKKQKKMAAAAADLESLVYARPEEEVLAASAEWSCLLPAAGRSRQLVMALTPAAIRAAIPALRAVLVDDE